MLKMLKKNWSSNNWIPLWINKFQSFNKTLEKDIAHKMYYFTDWKMELWYQFWIISLIEKWNSGTDSEVIESFWLFSS